MKIPTQYLLIMPIGQSKAMWQRKLRNLVANFANNASGATWWPNAKPIQVVTLGGQRCNLYKWLHLVAKFASNASHRVNFWVRCASGNVSKLGYQVAPLASIEHWATHQVTALSFFLTNGNQVAPLALVPKLATRLCHSHCHIALECPIGMIS